MIRVGRMDVPLTSMLDALAAESGPDRPIVSTDPDSYEQVHVKLRPDELAALRKHAEAANLPAWELIRKALRAYGLLRHD